VRERERDRKGGVVERESDIDIERGGRCRRGRKNIENEGNDF
jgi:hypothetical protein